MFFRLFLQKKDATNKEVIPPPTEKHADLSVRDRLSGSGMTDRAF